MLTNRYARRSGRVALAFGAAALMFARTAAAQSVTGSIQGTVVDQSGGVLPGVTATVTNTATGVMRATVTDTTGTFRAELLPVGTYDLSADLPGFTSRKQPGIDVTVGSTIT